MYRFGGRGAPPDILAQKPVSSMPLEKQVGQSVECTVPMCSPYRSPPRKYLLC